MRPTALRRALGALFAMTLACVSASCRPADEGAIEVAVIGGEPRLADAAAGPLDAPAAVLLANVAQGLVRFDANGQIEPGLAERWTVTNDGLSYIFRLAATEWPGGGRITAEQVARALRRQLAPRSENPLKDTFGAVDEIVAMTDRVLEIRLTAPRPNLLQLLAQPELAVIRNGQGSGPFVARQGNGRLTLSREISDGEDSRREEVRLRGLPAREAVRAFVGGEADLVLGGTFADLPWARQDAIGEDELRFVPVAGLFGLVATRADGPLADPELRPLLAQAVDR